MIMVRVTVIRRDAADTPITAELQPGSFSLLLRTMEADKCKLRTYSNKSLHETLLYIEHYNYTVNTDTTHLKYMIQYRLVHILLTVSLLVYYSEMQNCLM